MESLAVRGLFYQHRKGDSFALKDINFQVEQKEIFGLAGLSGSGKSTLCHCISGTAGSKHEESVSGQVLVNGRNILSMSRPELAFEIAMVFQNPDTQLFSYSVEDEISFGPENLCLASDEIRDRVDKTAELVGISDLLESNPADLSGGEKHLVAVAAVLALNPSILILDEVMSQLDRKGKKLMAEVLLRIRRAGKTVIIVEHDLNVLSICDRLMVLEKGQIVRCDKTEKILNDKDFLRARMLAG